MRYGGAAVADPTPTVGKRLLFCCEQYFPSRGGVQEVMRQIAERLVQRGHQITVATSWIPERTSWSHNGVEIRDFKVSGNLAQGMVGEIDRYREFVAAFAADAVLIKAAQQWTFDALWPVLDRITGRKVFIPCGFASLYDPAYASYFAQMPEVLRKFDHLIFYAEAYRDIDFARSHGLDKFSVLPNGASEAEFGQPADPLLRTRLHVSVDDFVFLTVGVPLLTKGHPQVAEAFARLETNGKSATLIMNGNWFGPSTLANILARCRQAFARAGPLGVWALLWRALENRRASRRMRRWIARANAQPGKRVLCMNLERPDLVAAYMASDLFVFASIVEYSPLVLFEAAAAGTPFLSVPVGNAEEIASWTGGGVICPAAKDARGCTRVDPQVLAREMGRLLKDDELRMQLGRTGKERWRRLFTWQAIAPRYEAILCGAPEIAQPEVRVTAP
jgi:glycosyltransferase involved in cell wall biosynthesis